MRIQKYLSHQRILSRREAEKQIIAGNVKVNGKTVTNLATQIDPEVDKVEVTARDKTTSILYYKPRGIVASRGTTEGKTVFDMLPQFSNLSLVGRLDKESEGLIILTNDGVLANIVTSDKHLIEKEYAVDVEETVTQTKINALSKVMYLTDGPTIDSQAVKLSDNQFSIIIREGRNHQIRRMADRVNLSVLKLTRVRIGEITDTNLEEGDWRPLTSTEVKNLKSAQ